MSHYQPKGDRSEAQQRRIGRSGGGSAHQRAGGVASTVKGGGAGGPPGPSPSAPAPLTHNSSSAVQSALGPSSVSSGRSVKRSNGATGQSTRGASPAGFELSDNQRVQRSASPPQHQMTQQAHPQPVVSPSKQPLVGTPSSNGAVSRSSRPGTPSSSSNLGSTQPVSPVVKTAGPREVPQGTVHPPYSFQFGSINASLIQGTGVQIPARTSSCPPILDEQKREQARFEVVSGTGSKGATIPSGGQQQQQQQQQLPSQARIEAGNATIGKVPPVPSGGQSVVPQMRQPAAILTAGTPQAQMPQSQGHHPLPVQLSQTSPHVQAQAAVTSQAHLQMQAHYVAAQSQQQGLVQLPLSQQIPSQQGLILQNPGQGMKFAQSMAGPPLSGQMMRPHLNSLSSQLSAQQIGQTSHQIGPQLSGALTNQISSGLPGVQYGLPATNSFFQPRTSSAVKIVHPETHEELRFDSKSIKGDSLIDNNIPAATASSTGRLVGNGPHTRPSMGYVGRAHPQINMNYYPAHQNGAFTPYYPASMPAKSGASASIAGTASARSSITQSSQGQGITVRTPSSQGQVGSVVNPIPSITPSIISASPADLSAESSGIGTATVAVTDQNTLGMLTGSNQAALNVDAKPHVRIEEKSIEVGKLDDSPPIPAGNVAAVPEHTKEAELGSSTAALIKDGNHTDLSVIASSDVKQGNKKKKKKESSSKSDAGNSGDSFKVHTPRESKKQVEVKIPDACVVDGNSGDSLKAHNPRESKKQVEVKIPDACVVDGNSGDSVKVHTPRESKKQVEVKIPDACVVDVNSGDSLKAHNPRESKKQVEVKIPDACVVDGNSGDSVKVHTPRESKKQVEVKVSDARVVDGNSGDSVKVHTPQESKKQVEVKVPDTCVVDGNSGDLVKVHTPRESKKQVEVKIPDPCLVEALVVTEATDASTMVVKADDEADMTVIDGIEEKIPEAAPASSLSSGLVLDEILGAEPAVTSVEEMVEDMVAADVLSAQEASAVNELDSAVVFASEAGVRLVSAAVSSSDLNHEVSENSVSKADDSHNVVESSSVHEVAKEEEQDDDKATRVNRESVLPLTCNAAHTVNLDDESQGTISLGTEDAVESTSLVGLSDGGNEPTSKEHEGSYVIADNDHGEERQGAEGDASCSPAIDSTVSFPPDAGIILDESVQPQSDPAGTCEPANTVKVEPSVGVTGKDGHPIDSSVLVAPDVKHGSKKKKMRDILAKADAAGTTADLYNAYKAPEEKKPDEMRAFEAIDTKVYSTDEVKSLAMPEDKASPRELDDWEDAAELPSPMVTTGLAASTAVDSLRTSETLIPESAGGEKYTRDFLLTFRDQNRELPSDFEIRADIAELLLSPQAVFSPSGERDTLSTSGRVLDRQLSGGSRRGNMVGNFEEDRWMRQLHSPGRPEAGHVEMGSAVSFRPGNSQGLIARMPSNVRSGLPIPPVGMGLIPGKPLMSPGTPLNSGPLRSNPVDADRWQRMPAGQKGLIAPLQTPLPAMHKAEKRYEAGKTSDDELSKQRQMKGILNKLTPQNFDKLFAQVKDVNIESAITLTGVISQIFDKALLEPTFCEMYAKFCVQLAVDLPEFIEDGDKVTFKRVLLNKCQEEFLRGEREQAEVDSVEEDGGGKLTVEEREEKRIKAKRRMLGNIRFIGELYKKSMLTERIMHECIQKLLGECDNPEEDVEALCKLMSTIGRMIDHVKAKEYMESYFDRMTKLSNDPKLSARLKFMLKDVIDLRRNGWQERRKVEGPKKIDEVHRDAVQERQGTGTQAGRLSRGSSIGASAGRRLVPPSDLTVRGSVSPLYSPSTLMGNVPSVGSIRGVQSQIGIRGSYGQDVRMEDRLLLENRPMPMPLSQRSVEEGPITLGPQGGLGKGMAVRGQPLGSGRSALLDPSPTTNLSDGRRIGPGVLPPYSSGMAQDRGVFGPRDEVTQRGVAAERPLTPSEGPLLERPVALDRYVSTSSSRGSRSLERTLSDRTMSSSMVSTAPQQQGLSSRPSTAPALLPLSDEQLRDKSESAVIEYFSARDLKEAAQCVEDLRAPRFHSTMVCLWFSISMEKNDIERELLVKLLIRLFNIEPVLLKQDQICRGIEMVLESLEDLRFDAPKAPEFLAVMIGKLITAGVISLVQAGKLLKTGDVFQSGYALDMFGRILEGLRQERGETGMLDLYRSSEIHLEEFVGSDDSQRKRFDVFLQEKNLQCLCPMSIIKG